MQPSFPVLTFPNHYTIVTGLLPAHHGIVANRMRDPGGARFRYSDSAAVRQSMWWGGEPVWVTAEQQVVRSATFFWPGSEAEIKGRRPTFSKAYDEAVPAADRVDTVLAWLTRPDSLPTRFVALYFSTVDHAGHDYGPHAPETRAAVLALDSAMGRLVGGLAAHGLTDQVNIVVVSDHGMAEVRADRVVVLDDLLDTGSVDLIESHALFMMNPKDGDTARLLRSLAGSPHLHAWRGDSVPAALRYTGHPRIPAVVGVPDEGWALLKRSTVRSMNRAVGGGHGYLPTDTSMHALFIAAGPGIRRSGTVEPFSNIHVYALLCELLGLRPAPNDGSLDSVRTLLRQER